ncbi:Afadin [Thelohanellus kitauei]|uniref:Afadin n=1 Tax=Thelohanellus kitauei TaxID=669202 RepID=A0A0C2MCC2_THEKT|nr:Afadin [Thelohanellus kitauei]
MKSKGDLQLLRRQIQTWNDEHNDLFKIEEIENDQFRGVIRFFSFDDNNKIQTKCIIATSLESTYEILQAYIRKTDPTMFASDFTVYTVFSNGGKNMLHLEYQLLDYTDCPLIKQISWVETAHDARFLIKRNRSLSRLRGKENISTDEIESDMALNKTNFILHPDGMISYKQ